MDRFISREIRLIPQILLLVTVVFPCDVFASPVIYEFTERQSEALVTALREREYDIIPNILNSNGWFRYHREEIIDLLIERLPEFPETLIQRTQHLFLRFETIDLRKEYWNEAGPRLLLAWLKLAQRLHRPAARPSLYERVFIIPFRHRDRPGTQTEAIVKSMGYFTQNLNGWPADRSSEAFRILNAFAVDNNSLLAEDAKYLIAKLKKLSARSTTPLPG